MKIPFQFFFAPVLLAAASTVADTNLNVPSSIASWPVRPGFVHVELASQSPSYRVDQTVRIAFSLINMTGEVVFFPYGYPEDLITLVVIGPSGERIEPGDSDDNEISTRMEPFAAPLTPGVPSRLKWRGEGGETIEFCDIRDWGYSLRAPGTYTITAIPTITAYTETRGHSQTRVLTRFRTDFRTVSSNVITVTITP